MFLLLEVGINGRLRRVTTIGLRADGLKVTDSLRKMTPAMPTFVSVQG